jgi:hypothetical protein
MRGVRGLHALPLAVEVLSRIDRLIPDFDCLPIVCPVDRVVFAS